MQCPEFGIVLISDQSVNFVGGLGADEWGCADIHNKQDNSGSEQVSLDTCVFTHFHLWWLIAFSAQLGVQNAITVMALQHCGETEIRNLQAVVLIEQNIFRLEITMGDTDGVKVLD